MGTLLHRVNCKPILFCEHKLEIPQNLMDFEIKYLGLTPIFMNRIFLLCCKTFLPVRVAVLRS